MKRFIAIVTLLVALSACTPKPEQIMPFVDETLTALPTRTTYPTNTPFPTYTPADLYESSDIYTNY